MIHGLRDKNIVLGVTGSIASYKALDLASKLTQGGASVNVILSKAASRFISPLAFQAITHRPVTTEMFEPNSGEGIEHVALAEWANLVVIAPATANVIARLASGLADDPLTTTILATEAPVLIAPAMDGHMYDNQATQANLSLLKQRGVTVVGPAEGRLASGLVGMGRLVETVDLLGHITTILGKNGDLAGRTIVISAGGTQEPIDPVRVITNRSSGKMGYALAEVARDRGARVTLVTAPSNLYHPVELDVVPVNTALEMRAVILDKVNSADVLIMASAVSDYRPTITSANKIKKDDNPYRMELTTNPDILLEAQGAFIKVGFAAETENLLDNARSKLGSKSLDLIVANDITDPDCGFSTDTNRVTFIRKDGSIQELPLMSKHDVAYHILDEIVGLIQGSL